MLIYQAYPKSPLFLSHDPTVIRKEIILFNHLIAFIFLQMVIGKVFVWLDKRLKLNLTKKLFIIYQNIENKNNTEEDVP